MQGAGKSAMWKTITNKAAPLVEHLHTLRQAQIASLPMPRALSGFHGSDVAELAVALEGEKILSDLQSSQFDPNSGFLVVLRLIGTRDVNDLIQLGLEAIDKEVPALRSQIEKSMPSQKQMDEMRRQVEESMKNWTPQLQQQMEELRKQMEQFKVEVPHRSRNHIAGSAPPRFSMFHPKRWANRNCPSR